MPSLIEAAQYYLSIGWAVVPTLNKKPCCSYKKLPPLNKESQECLDIYLKQFKKYTEAQGIALIIDRDMVVLDLDSERAVSEYSAIPEETIGIKTHRGVKYIFQDRTPDLIDTALTLLQRAGSAKFHIKEDVEIILEGMLCEIPPGLHPSGQPYKWIKEPKDGSLTSLPEVLFNAIRDHGQFRQQSKGLSKQELDRLLKGVSEGERNEAGIKIAGHLIGKNNTWTVIEDSLRSWNQRNRPPMDDKELEGIIESAHKYYDEKPKPSLSSSGDKEAQEEIKQMTEAEINLLRTNFAHRRLECVLPEDHFITQFVRYADRMTDGYSEYKILGGFWLLSALTQRNPYIDLATSSDGVYLDVWGQFIGLSSLSRKTTILDIARKFFSYAQGAPLTDTDYSLEGYVESLAATPILPMINDEVSTIFQKMSQKYNSGYYEFECKIYDCQSQNKRLASGGKKEPRTYTIKDPYVTKLYATTFVKYKRSITIPDFDSGFGFRFLYAAPTYDFKQRPPRLRTPEDLEDRSKMELRTAQLYELFKHSGSFTMDVTPEAFEYYIKTDYNIQNEIKRKTNQELLGQAWSRYSIYILKLAALIELGKIPVSQTIDLDSVKIATSMILDYFFPTLCDVYSLLTVDPVNNKIDKILEALKDFKGVANHSVLLRKSRLESREFRSLIDTMLESGQIELITEKNPKNGKVTNYYHYIDCDKVEFKNPSSPNPQIHTIPRFTDVESNARINENLDIFKECVGVCLNGQSKQSNKIQILTDPRMKNTICVSGNLENFGINVNLDSSFEPKEYMTEKEVSVVVSEEEALKILEEAGF